METLKKQLVIYGLTIILAFVAWGVSEVFFLKGSYVVAGICGAVTAWCTFVAYCEIRDYRFYKKLSAKMKEKTLDERLKLLHGFEECWLVYATQEEVDWFHKAYAENPDDINLNYLLERAASYKK